MVPCGMSQDESYMVRGAMSIVVIDAHTVRIGLAKPDATRTVVDICQEVMRG